MNKILNAIEDWRTNKYSVRETYRNLPEFLRDHEFSVQDTMDLIARFSYALKEIQKKEGRYSSARRTHAENTIEDMAQIAEDAFILEQ